MINRKKTIGILGGMGPAATVDLLNLIIENTDASCDQEHIHIVVDCNPLIPDRTEAIIGNGKSPLPELIKTSKKLENHGADFILIPCNTSHCFFDRIQEAIDIPIVNMIEETAKAISLRNYKTAIILCTEGTRKIDIYSKYLSKYNVLAKYPDKELQDQVNKIIYSGIKSGSETYNVELFNNLLEEEERKYQAISVLACTELPIAQKKYKIIGNFINPSLVLAQVAINKAGYRIK